MKPSKSRANDVRDDYKVNMIDNRLIIQIMWERKNGIPQQNLSILDKAKMFLGVNWET